MNEDIHQDMVDIATRHVESLAIDVAGDPLRPIYHVAARANWMNDPHGAIVYGGKLHLFYQTNPYGKNSGFVSWGHVASSDGVYWEHRPLALVPTPNSRDEHGVFSGCCVLFPDPSNRKVGKPTVFYTGVRRDPEERPRSDYTLFEQHQFMAVCRDRSKLDRWKKEKDPIIRPSSHPDHGRMLPESLDCMRDPFVWQDRCGSWFMLIGSSRLSAGNSQQVEGNALLYAYKKLEEGDYGWKFCGTFCDTPRGRNWECCNYLRLKNGEKTVEIIIISPEFEDKAPGIPNAKKKKNVMWALGSTGGVTSIMR